MKWFPVWTVQQTGGTYMENVTTNGHRQASSDSENFALKVATAVGSTAGYLQTHDVQEMIRDAEDAARRYPVPSLIGAAALGLFLGAFLRRS